MPTFKVQGPDGRVVPVNAPDGQTALRMAQQQYATRSAQPSPTPGLFGDKTAPGGFGSYVAHEIGAQDPAYQRAYAHEQQIDSGPFSHQRDPVSQVTAPFVPYVQGALGYASQGVDNMRRAATGQPIETPASVAGQAAQDYERNAQAAWAKAHPAQAIAGNVAGMAVLGPARAGTLIRGVPYVPAVKTATTLGQKAVNLAKAMGTGGVIGGTYGAAEAPDGHHLEGAITGGLTGAAMAPVLAGATKVVQAAAKPVIGAIANRAGPAVIGASVPKVPARQALDYVTRKLGQAGVATSDLAASTAPTAAEAAGNTGRVSLAALARQSGKTPAAAEQMLWERRDGRPQRILDTVSRVTGIDPSGAKGSVDAIIQKGQADATPLFDAVRATPGSVWSPELAQLSERPAMKDALKMTVNALKNQGKDPLAMGLRIDPDTGKFIDAVEPATGKTREIGDVVQMQPTAEAWENVRQMLGDLGKESPNMSNTQRIQAKGFQAAQRDLTSHLAGDENGEGALIPGYRDALNVAGDYKSVQGAFNDARGKLFSQKFTPGDLSDMQDGATEAEQNAIRHAGAADMFDAAQNGRLTLNGIKSPAFRSKLMLMYGPDAAGQISDMLSNEAQQAAAEQQIIPQAGSQTAPLNAAIKEQQENPLGDFALDAATGAMRHGATGVVEAGFKAGMKGLASGLKTPGMGTDARDEAGRLFMMSPSDLHDYLNSNSFTPNTLKAPPITPFIAGRLGGDISGALMPQPDNDPAYQPLVAAQ